MGDNDWITLIIEGLPEDEGRVRLSAFVAQLQNLNATISKIDKEANGKTTTYLRIAELSYNSPVRVVLEPQPLPNASYFGSILIGNLERLTTTINHGGDLSVLDADLLEDIRGLTRPVGRTVKSSALVFRDHTFDLTPKILSDVEKALAVDEECRGSIEGMLEQINLHDGANVFHIYPDVGPRKVICHFPTRLLDDAVAAVGRRVEVQGTLRYRAGAFFPHQVSVVEIEAFPIASDLPDWEDLRGRAPNATGDLSSEAFVRELRDGWR
ncbi:hypothetical protein [Xanthobacter sp. KR7-225]|uniref:hypothetical protein n=1 Tax=Xanthobacter sp. KR7-225 TaxID=3156613 RepID=UPI0032B3931E